MKKKLTLFTAIAIFGLAACNDATNNKSTTDSVVVVPNNSNTTATTTTTTTVTTRKLNNKQVVVLGTNKKVRLVYDTVHYYYVDAATNLQPSGYYYDPETKDTFDYRGYNLNNALMYKDGKYVVDEDKLMNNAYNMEIRDESHTMPAPNSTTDEKKIKENENSYKEKTDTSKIKITDRKTKIKIKTPQ